MPDNENINFPFNPSSLLLLLLFSVSSLLTGSLIVVVAIAFDCIAGCHRSFAIHNDICGFACNCGCLIAPDDDVVIFVVVVLAVWT